MQKIVTFCSYYTADKIYNTHYYIIIPTLFLLLKEV